MNTYSIAELAQAEKEVIIDVALQRSKKSSLIELMDFLLSQPSL